MAHKHLCYNFKFVQVPLLIYATRYVPCRLFQRSMAISFVTPIRVTVTHIGQTTDQLASCLLIKGSFPQNGHGRHGT